MLTTALKSDKARLLFVDDEQRVLNSMRIMFRRQFDLFLAADGKEALKIVEEEDIDVIVADHRMPHMTGVEVLSAVRGLSPRTVRILLTGYADLDAVEGSINEGEVFRFLTKPCAADQLRSTIELAATVARESKPNQIEPAAKARQDALTAASSRAHERTAVIEPRPLSAGEPVTAPAAPRGDGFGVVVFTDDENVLEAVQKAARGRVPIYHARNIVKVVRILDEYRPGVLLTDIAEDKATIQTMTAQLKGHIPELVTIAISQHRDVLDMVWLINHGQIFRFLRKPLSPGRCAVSLQSALEHHRMLLENPNLLKRHEVEALDETTFVAGVLEKLRSVKQLWAAP